MTQQQKNQAVEAMALELAEMMTTYGLFDRSPREWIEDREGPNGADLMINNTVLWRHCFFTEEDKERIEQRATEIVQDAKHW